jgi:hypothetical protein
MMGRQRRDQGKLFYEFRLDDRIPQNQPETVLRWHRAGMPAMWPAGRCSEQCAITATQSKTRWCLRKAMVS